MSRSWLLLLFLLSVGFLLPAQPTDREASSASYLLRLERGISAEAVCVLLKGNGQYHLERHGERVRVFEGNLDPDELRTIVHLVSEDQLYGLEQRQIPDSMLRSDADRVKLAILRPGHWQQLDFPDSASRTPYRESLDPLLQWLDTLVKRKALELSEEQARNNCLPSRTLNLSRRDQTGTTQSATVAGSKLGTDLPSSAANAPRIPAPKMSEYILRMEDTRSSHQKVEVTCLIVSSSGSYHFVRQSTSVGDKSVSSAVLNGTLDETGLTSLRAILDAPELRNERSLQDQFGQGANRLRVFVGGDDLFVTLLSIPRGGKTQTIGSWKTPRTLGFNGGLPEEHGAKIMKPFREWLQRSIDSSRAVPSNAPVNAQCRPED